MSKRDGALALSVGVERWPLAKAFTISRGAKTDAVTVVARVSDGRHVGVGEATPYARYGETPEAVADAVEAQRGLLGAAESLAAERAVLVDRLPAGAARNALDCALWDLEAKQTGCRVADLAGLTPPPSVTTAVTLSIDTPQAMGEEAARLVSEKKASLIKAKLGAGTVEEEAERLRAIRAGAPKASLIIDANEGWSIDVLKALDPLMAEIDVLFVEQPLPSAEDSALGSLTLKTRLCADESCHTADDLDRLAGLYQVVNVKLDKTGGLTGGIALREEALARGFETMIGCMVAGSLAMAPAYLLTEGALAVDLDGPLLLAGDRQDAIRYDGVQMHAPSAALWG